MRSATFVGMVMVSVALISCTRNLQQPALVESAAPALQTGPATGKDAGLPPINTAPLYNLEMLGNTVDPFSQAHVTVSSSDPIRISGWAVDAAARDIGSAVDIVIDQSAMAANYPSSRADVAQYFKTPAYDRAGFELVLPAGELAPGVHSLTVRVVNKQATGYYEGAPLSFSVR